MHRDLSARRGPSLGQDGCRRGDFGNPDAERTWEHHDYLAHLATLCELAHVRFMGTHDAYAESSRLLVVRQRPDGAWGSPPDLDRTVLALLALAHGGLDATGPGFEPPRPAVPLPAPK